MTILDVMWGYELCSQTVGWPTLLSSWYLTIDTPGVSRRGEEVKLLLVADDLQLAQHTRM